jgi:hypothetical protein
LKLINSRRVLIETRYKKLLPTEETEKRSGRRCSFAPRPTRGARERFSNAAPNAVARQIIKKRVKDWHGQQR